MKKTYCLILSVILFLTVVGCSHDNSVLPPSRIGQGTMQASLAERYSLESAMSAADVVARVEVGSWLAEDADISSTYFEAKVLECFKGKLSGKFTLIQDGCSATTLKSYPLFTAGNEILVFLKTATMTEYPSCYWIIGSFTTVLDVSYDESGARYYADRYGVLGESAGGVTNYAQNTDIANEVLARAAKEDPIISEMQYAYPYIFAEADIRTLLGKG